MLSTNKTKFSIQNILYNLHETIKTLFRALIVNDTFCRPFQQLPYSAQNVKLTRAQRNSKNSANVSYAFVFLRKRYKHSLLH